MNPEPTDTTLAFDGEAEPQLEKKKMHDSEKEDKDPLLPPLVAGATLFSPSAAAEKEAQPAPRWTQCIPDTSTAGGKLLCFGLASLVVLSATAIIATAIVCGSGGCAGGGGSSFPTAPPFEWAPLKFSPLVCDSVSTNSYGTAQELQDAFDDETSGTVLVLTNDIELPDNTPLVLERSGVTVVGCCSNNIPSKKCTIQGSGQGRNFIVTGSDFAIENMVIRDGYGQSQRDSNGDACGANLLLDGSSSGTYRVTGCEFYHGQCSNSAEGGNLHVRTPGGNVFLNHSLFASGVAVFGGGAAVVDASNIVMENCQVADNKGSGLAHFIWNNEVANPGQHIVIRNSEFSNNEGEFGGAIFGSNFGTMPKLEVWDTRFDSNRCTDDCGGTASVIGSTGPLNITWVGNSATGEHSNGKCQEVYVGGYTSQGCFLASDDFTWPL